MATKTCAYTPECRIYEHSDAIDRCPPPTRSTQQRECFRRQAAQHRCQYSLIEGHRLAVLQLFATVKGNTCSSGCFIEVRDVIPDPVSGLNACYSVRSFVFPSNSSCGDGPEYRIRAVCQCSLIYSHQTHFLHAVWGEESAYHVKKYLCMVGICFGRGSRTLPQNQNSKNLGCPRIPASLHLSPRRWQVTGR